MMQKVYAHYNTFLGQSCGVGELGTLRFFSAWGEGEETNDLKRIHPQGGCGWVIVGFTNQRSEYKAAYLQLCERWKKVYQSPVRRNNRTGNDFFFCIFDSRSKP